jgi:hypothetical protein
MSDGLAFVLFLLCVLCAIVCSVIRAHDTGMQHGREEMQQEAIEHGFAEYNTKSGEWQWKNAEAELVK